MGDVWDVWDLFTETAQPKGETERRSLLGKVLQMGIQVSLLSILLPFFHSPHDFP